MRKVERVRLRKSKNEKAEASFQGAQHPLNGVEATRHVEWLASDAIIVGGAWEIDASPNSGTGAEVFRGANARDMLARATGHAVTGDRTTVLLDTLAGAEDALLAVAGRRLPVVVHLCSRARRRHAASLGGGHDDVHAGAASGWFQLFAKNVQEAADLTLVAHRVAELALTPGICAQDLYDTTHSVQLACLPDAKLIAGYLGQPADWIGVPTPSQRALFGERRRRVPQWIDPDRPAGLGGVQEPESYMRAVAAQRVFFTDHLTEMIAGAFQTYGELTGRHYQPLGEYRVDDADLIVVAQGATVEGLERVADHLRDRGVKAGVINIRMARPFPGGALSTLLKGKSAVTVLERTDDPLSEDGPLLGAVRAAIDKASENGAAKGGRNLPYPGYAVYKRVADRPQLFSGICRVGDGIPSSRELAAVFRNMDGGDGAELRRFYVGVDVGAAPKRLPYLETQHGALRKSYAGMDTLTLPVEDVNGKAIEQLSGTAFELTTLAMQGGIFAVNTFAQAWVDVTGGEIRTFPRGGLEETIQPATIGIWQDKARIRSERAAYDGSLVSGDALTESLPSRTSIRPGGVVVVETHREPEAFLRALSRRVTEWIRSRDLRIHVLDARRIAAESASRPSFVDQLAVWALLGAASKSIINLSSKDLDHVSERLRLRLAGLIGKDHPMIADITGSLRAGYEEVTFVDLVAAPPAEPEVETDAPWTIPDDAKGDETVYDPARFWRSVGFLYERARERETLTDPHVATGMIPGASSAFRDMTTYRLRIPEWLPENCTGCGLCWAHCPDSALPASLQSANSILDAAVRSAEAEGAALIQFKRIAGHVAKQAHRLVAADDRHQVRLATDMLREAYTEVAGKMNLDNEKREVLDREFDSVCASPRGLLVSRTARFFDGPEKTEKGSGALLTIALNPMTCKGCGLCAAVCADAAIDWATPEPERIAAAKERWRFAMTLPDVASDRLARHVEENAPDSYVHRLLERQTYHSMVGGDGAPPGSGVKTAVHLVASAVEAVVRPRFARHVERLSDLRRRLQDKIQGNVSTHFEINDFREFASRLDRLQNNEVSPGTLAGVVGDGDAEREIDAAKLKRMATLLQKLEEQLRRYEEGPTGWGRARMILTIDPGAMTRWLGLYPDNPLPYPWIAQLSGDAGALGSGVAGGLLKRLADEAAVCRRVEREIDDKAGSADSDVIPRAGDFTLEEWECLPPVVVLCERATLRWSDVSRAVAARYPTIFVVLNGDGVQGLADRTASGPVAVDDLAMRTIADGRAFLVQSTTGHPGHLLAGVSRAVSRGGITVVHVYAPDPGTSGVAPEKTAELASLAYRSRAFPLLTYDPDTGCLSLDGNPESNAAWTRIERVTRETSGGETRLVSELTPADWAAAQARLQHQFQVMSKGHRSGSTLPVAEYARRPIDARGDFVPYVDVVDEQQRHFIATASQRIVDAVQSCAERWRDWQAMASNQPLPRAKSVQQAPDAPAPPTTATGVSEEALVQRVAERLLALSGYGQEPAYFDRKLRDFVAERGNGKTPSGQERDPS